MNRDEFARQFIARGKASGASREEVAQKLAAALREFDAGNIDTGDKGGVLKGLTDIFFGRTKEFGRTLASAGEALGAEAAMKGSEVAMGASQATGGNKFMDQLASWLAGGAQNLAKSSLNIREQQGTTNSIQNAQGEYDWSQLPHALATTGQEVGKRAVGAYGELGSYLLPLGKATTFGGKIVQGAKLGGKMGLLRGATTPDLNLVSLDKKGKVDKQKTMEQWLKRAGETVTEGATGYVAGGVATGVTEAIKGIARMFPKASDWLNKKAAQMLLEEKKGEIKLNEEWESEHANKLLEWLRDGKITPGSRNHMRKQLQEIINNSEQGIKNELKGRVSGRTVNGKEFLMNFTKYENGVEVSQTFDDLIREAEKQLAPERVGQYQKFLELFKKEYGKNMSERQVNEMRKAFNKTLSNKDFIKELQDNPGATVLKRKLLNVSRRWLAQGNEKYSQLLDDESSALALLTLLESGQRRALSPGKLGTVWYFITSVPTKLLQKSEALSVAARGEFPVATSAVKSMGNVIKAGGNLPVIKPAREFIAKQPAARVATPAFEAMRRYMTSY